MPKVVLNERNRETRVPRALVAVRAFAHQGGAAVRTIALHDGRPVPPPAVPPPPGTLVVGIDQLEDLVVRVAPLDGSVFAPGASVTIVLEAAGHSVEIGPVDVAGVRDRDILWIGMDGGEVSVRAMLETGTDPLSPLGEAVRVATIDLLGTQRVDEGAAFNPGIVIDGSASFRRFASDGRLRRLLEVLSGVFGVTSVGRPISVGVSGIAPRIEQLATAADIPPRASALVDAAQLVTGARLADASLYASDLERNSAFFVVTDSGPADLPALVAVDAIPGKAVHLVLVGDPSLAVTELDGIPVTLVDERVLAGDDQTVISHLPAASIVRSLLRAAFSPGTAAYDRVTR